MKNCLDGYYSIYDLLSHQLACVHFLERRSCRFSSSRIFFRVAVTTSVILFNLVVSDLLRDFFSGIPNISLKRAYQICQETSPESFGKFLYLSPKVFHLELGWQCQLGPVDVHQHLTGKQQKIFDELASKPTQFRKEGQPRDLQGIFLLDFRYMKNDIFQLGLESSPNVKVFLGQGKTFLFE